MPRIEPKPSLGISLEIEVSEEWVQRARRTPIDKEWFFERLYEGFGGLGYSPQGAAALGSGRPSDWEGAFLRHVQLGPYSGISFEPGIPGPAYSGHNIDTAVQALAGIKAVMDYDRILRAHWSMRR